MVKHRSGEEFPVSCSMKVINWLRKRVEEEMKVRDLASHSLLPIDDHCAVFINNYDGSGSFS